MLILCRDEMDTSKESQEGHDQTEDEGEHIQYSIANL